MPVPRCLPPVLLAGLLGMVLAACGSEAEPRDPIDAVHASARDRVAAAQDVDVGAFPKPGPGQSLEDFAQQFDTDGPQAVSASSVMRPPTNRLAFGLLDTDQRFAYGRTVVYVQRRGSTAPIAGPIAAPADVLVTEPRYRSKQAAGDDDPFAAIYRAEVPTPKPGIFNVLAVSDLGDRRIAAPMAIQVVSKREDKVPDVGERAPRVETDTLASVDGEIEMLTTRLPGTQELAPASFADVVGRKPVALLFATPQLCQSRVCGPVTDAMLQLKQRYEDEMTFIHQEVYVDNDPQKGVRPPLRRFRLPSEPWLFTVRRDGTIASRLEGSIGLKDFEAAVRAALE